MSNFEAHCYLSKGRICRNHRALQKEMDWGGCKNPSRRRGGREEGCVIGGAGSARSSVLLPWQVSSLLVSNPSKILKDIPSNVFSVEA